MAAIELRLTLDRNPAEFIGGETIEGSFDAYVQERCECRSLSVFVGWEAKSQHESDSGYLPSVTFDGGTFEPGYSRSHRFALELPRTIWSYTGQTFSLSYAVQAKADLANVSDSHAEAPIVLRPADGITPNEIAPSLGVIMSEVEGPVPPIAAQRSIAADQMAAKFQPGCMIVMGVFSILFSLPFLFASIFLYGTFLPLARDIGPLAVVPLVFWMVLGVGVPAISGIVMLYTGLRPLMARWLLGEVTVDLPDRLTAPGAALTCRISMQPKRDVEIQSVRLILRARETVWTRTKNSRRSNHRTIRSDERMLEGARSVRTGDYVELNGRIDVPTDAAYSLGAPNHWVEWHVLVHVALRGWIDHQSEHLVTVAPGTMTEPT